MKLLVPALKLKGSHYYLHPQQKYSGKPAHLIHWNREGQPTSLNPHLHHSPSEVR